MATNLTLDTPAADDKKIRVDADLHVLAAGAADGQLRLTLQLEPRPDDQGPLNLQGWPSGIAAELRDGVTLSFIPLRNAAPDRALNPSNASAAPIHLTAVARGLGALDEAGVRTAETLWIRSLQPDANMRDARAEAAATTAAKARARAAGRDPDDVMVEPIDAPNGRWGDLRDALILSQGNKGITASSGMAAGSGQAVPLDRDEFGADGQIAPRASQDSAEIAGVLPVPHADLALALDQQRAHELRLSIAEICGAAGCRTAAEAARCEDLECDPIYAAIRPILEAPEFGDAQRAALAKLLGDDLDLPAIAPDTDSSEVQREKAIKALRRALKVREYRSLNANLNSVRGAVATRYKEEADRLEAGTCGVPGPEDAHLCATRAHDVAAREIAMDQARKVHDYSSWPQYAAAEEALAAAEERKKGKKALNEQLIVQRYAAFKADPILARCFGLTVDLTVPEDALEDGFYLVAASFGMGGRAAGDGATWTLLERSSGGAGVTFWPATEYAAAQALSCQPDLTETEASAAKKRPAPTQSAGMLSLSSGTCGAEAPQPRFDLTSIDLRGATEGEMQRRRTRQSNRNAAVPPQDAVAAPPPLQDDLSLGARVLTGGLTFLMRSAGSDAATHLARRGGRGAASADTVLDADDLTTGLRPMIGLPHRDATGIYWAPLTGREVDYGTSGDAFARAEVESLVAAIKDAGINGAVLEHGYQSGATRLLPAANRSAEAMIDEAVTTWDGSPMGIDVTQAAEPSRDVQIFGRTVKLLRAEDRPVALRFGVPYCTALAAVYSGGVSRTARSLPVLEAKAGAAVYPAPNTAPGVARPFFRFLRHEKIAAPGFALPIGHALRSHGKDRVAGQVPFCEAGPMGFDTGPRMVVRSVLANSNGDTKAAASRTTAGASVAAGPKLSATDDPRMIARAGPTISHRAVLVPNVPFDLAEWHGVFDTITSGSDRPASAFTEFAGARSANKNNTAREALVVTRTEQSRGLNNRRSITRRGYTARPQAAQSQGVVLGDAVLKVSKSFASRAQDRDESIDRFYADPFATRLAFAIRLKGETAYLKGGPLIYEVIRPGETAERLPVIVTVETGPAKSRSRPISALRDIVTVGPANGVQDFYPDSAGDGFAEESGQHTDALELRIALRPGEDVEIDTWVLPESTALAREHALIQALGVNLSNCGADTGCDPRDALLTGARTQLPGRFARCLAAHLALAGDGQAPSYTAPGGIAAPDNSSLKALGAAVVDMLHLGPLPELVGMTTLEAVHACNSAPAQPAAPRAALPIDPEVPELPPLSGPIARPMRAARPAGLEAPLDEPLAISAPGSSHLVLDGAVAFDSAANDTVEIVADVTLPGTTAFDDRARGRSLQQRRVGEWPPLRDLDGSVRTYRTEDGKDLPLYRDAKDLFGFAVRSDGGTELEKARVSLLRVEGLPRTLPGGPLDLRALFLGQPPDGARIAHRHIFPDGKARRMKVRLNALSRTLEDMRTAARVATDGDAWLAAAGEGLVYEAGDHVPAEPVPEQFQENLSDAVEIFLPATIRPAKPDAKAPIPLLDVSTDAPKDAKGLGARLWHRRAATLRIPLGREWYSSGEDEQVGLVLWPPQLGGQSGTKVKIPPRYSGDKRRVVDLAAMGTECLMFADEDLGPGGAFVSRRGSDPVRGGRETEPVLRPAAIADLFRTESDIRCAEFVPDVQMPLDAETAEEQGADAAPLPPMRVGLALYRPRFDPEREEWFIDVTLDPAEAPDGFVRFGLVRYQPHAVPALRCSRPVVQWAQPLGARTASVARAAGGDLLVQVEGPASRERVALEAKNLGPEHHLGVDLSALTSAPAMRLTLFRETTGLGGEAQRKLLHRKTRTLANLGDTSDQVETPLADYVVVQPEAGHGPHVTWCHKLDITQYDDPEPNTGQLRLLVEEIEHFRPASYAEEPVAAALKAEWRTRFQEAGPRFSALFNLEDLP